MRRFNYFRAGCRPAAWMPAADLLARLPSFSLQLHPPFLSSNRVNRTDNASPTLFSRDLLPFSLRLSFPKPTSRRKPPSKSKSFIVRSHSFIRSSKFVRFSFFFFSLFLATRFSEFSSSNERATLEGGVTRKKKDEEGESITIERATSRKHGLEHSSFRSLLRLRSSRGIGWMQARRTQ